MRVRNAVAVVACGGLVVAGAANAGVIVPMHGIDGVRLGQTQAAVRAVHGAPVRVVRGTNDFGPYTTFRYRGLTVGFQGNLRVTSVSTGVPAHRTPGGVGVGTPEALLRARIPAVRCETIGEFRACDLGASLAGRVVTDFVMAGGRVRRVTVGVIID